MGEIDFAALTAPFDPKSVHWRVGSTTQDKKRGLALAYLDARDVMDRLDAVIGPENWSDSYAFEGERTLCTLTIAGVGKTDGAGDTDIEGEKGGLSDAFKRAAVKWGIGRYLYRCESPWVDIETFGKTSKIKKGQDAKLAKALGSTAKVAPAPPPEPEPVGEIESGDGPPAQMSAENVGLVRKAIGPRCRELGIEVNEYGPIIEKWVAHGMGFADLAAAPDDMAPAMIDCIRKYKAGDEATGEGLPF